MVGGVVTEGERLRSCRDEVTEGCGYGGAGLRRGVVTEGRGYGVVGMRLQRGMVTEGRGYGDVGMRLQRGVVTEGCGYRGAGLRSGVVTEGEWLRRGVITKL